MVFLPERKKSAKTSASLINHLSATKAVTGLEELLRQRKRLGVLCARAPRLLLRPALHPHLLALMAGAINSPLRLPASLPRASSVPGGGSRRAPRREMRPSSPVPTGGSCPFLPTPAPALLTRGSRVAQERFKPLLGFVLINGGRLGASPSLGGAGSSRELAQYQFP